VIAGLKRVASASSIPAPTKLRAVTRAPAMACSKAYAPKEFITLLGTSKKVIDDLANPGITFELLGGLFHCSQDVG
jgi:hypothetical protein